MPSMDPSMLPFPGEASLPAGIDPVALLEVGFRPNTEGQGGAEPPLSAEEVGAMLPAYEVRRLIGRGGMGRVFEAIQRDLQRRVAIKVLSPSLTNVPGLTARFRHEARLMASLGHPGVVRVYEAGETAEGYLYYVMEFVDGEDLASRLSRGRLPLEEAVPLIADIAEALEAAHRLGIVHRDIKPANIFLSAQGPPRLGDFGLAVTAGQSEEALRLTRVGTTVGTVEYSAPEQLSRVQPVSPASDVFSLGVVTYEVLTGELPRGNFDPPSLRREEVDAAFDSVVLRALQTDPARRFADAGKFREAFLHAADRRRQEALRQQAVRRKMVRRAWIMCLLAAIALVTGGSAIVAWKARRDAEAKQAAAEAAEQRMSDLIQFLLTDLRTRLEPTGNLGAMESVLEKAVEHFRRVYEESGHSPIAARKLADVLVVKGDVIGVRGMNDEADQLYTEALSLTELARDATPQDAKATRRVMEALQDRSEHRMATGRYPDALLDARQLLREAEALAKQQPGSESTHALAKAHRAVAHSLGYTGGVDEAGEEYHRVQSLLQQLAGAAPDRADYARELAELDMSLGSNAEARGDLVGMLRHFTAWHDYVIRHDGPDTSGYSYSAFRMGVALQKLDRSVEAVPYLADAVRIAERESAALPGHKGCLNHLSWCLRFLGQSYEGAGDVAAAARVRQREAEVNAALSAAP